MNYNVIDDAKKLREAIQKFNAQILINILCYRTNNQRQIICHEYQNQFGRCLIEDIKSKTHGNFKQILCALLTPPLDYKIKILRKAISAPIVDANAIVEFLCGYKNSEINTLAQEYTRKYKQSLEDNIRLVTAGHFQRIMLKILEGREENTLLDYNVAQHESELLLQGGVFKTIPREHIFNTVFCCRNYNQIRITDKEYKRITGQSLEFAIINQFSGSVRDALCAILSATYNRSEYFADKLYKSMVGLGTSDSQLIRIFVSRSEIDLMNIKNVFEHKYGNSLHSWIKGDTSGDYRDCLLALIQENC